MPQNPALYQLIKTTLCSSTKEVGTNKCALCFGYRANIFVIGVKQLLGLYILMCCSCSSKRSTLLSFTGVLRQQPCVASPPQIYWRVLISLKCVSLRPQGEEKGLRRAIIDRLMVHPSGA